jgi:hypothetical protein
MHSDIGSSSRTRAASSMTRFKAGLHAGGCYLATDGERLVQRGDPVPT